MDMQAHNPASFINAYNASIALGFILNFDLNAIDERHLKIGLPNFIDLPKTKRLCFLLNNSNTECHELSEELVDQIINLSNVLNQEAKQDLFEYLTWSKQP